MTLAPGQLDEILTYQLAVAWAGETGEEPRRLGWWQTDMISRYGGHALFEQLAPRTYGWAALEVAREAARRVDEGARQKNANPDQLVSLFHFGFDIDEQIQDRLDEHKRSGRPPEEALPRLAELTSTWDPKAFAKWLQAGDPPKASDDPTGRRLTMEPPDDPVKAARRLAHALIPLHGRYPCPHYRDARSSK